MKGNGLFLCPVIAYSVLIIVEFILKEKLDWK